MLHRTKSLVDERSRGYVVRRSNVALAALSAFLDVSSLNLAVLQGAAIFSARGQPITHRAADASVTMRPAEGDHDDDRIQGVLTRMGEAKASEVSVLPPPVGTVSVKTPCGSAALATAARSTSSRSALSWLGVTMRCPIQSCSAVWSAAMGGRPPGHRHQVHQKRRRRRCSPRQSGRKDHAGEEGLGSGYV
jgi:hypothetical protein